MSSEMIERAAAAMWDAAHWSPEMPTFAHERRWADEWPDGYQALRDMIRIQARAAIEAMRTPTEAMLAAITPSHRWVELAPGHRERIELLGSSPEGNYRAMIDAALSPTKD